MKRASLRPLAWRAFYKSHADGCDDGDEEHDRHLLSNLFEHEEVNQEQMLQEVKKFVDEH